MELISASKSISRRISLSVAIGITSLLSIGLVVFLIYSEQAKLKTSSDTIHELNQSMRESIIFSMSQGVTDVMPFIERMKAMTKYDSGFKLSEIDLKLRGPGDFMGKRQWGIPDFVMSSLNNLEIIREARSASEEVFPVTNEKLKRRLEAFEEKLHLE